MIYKINDIFLNSKYIKTEKKRAETLVLVHGLGLDMTIWNSVLELFQSKYHVLVLDIPGHGESLFTYDQCITWERLLDSIDYLLNKNEITEFHFIGHSSGGNLGLEAVQRFKERMLSLTLISTPILVPKELGEEVINTRLSAMGRDAINAVVDNIIPNLCYPSTKEKEEKLKVMYSKTSSVVYQKYFQLIADRVIQYTPNDLQQLKLPILIINGEQDALYPAELQALNLPYLKHHRFYIVPEAANLPMIDQPKCFVQFIENFIEKLHEENTKVYYTEKLNYEIQKVVESGLENSTSAQTIEVQIINGFKVIMNGQEIMGKWNQRKAKEIFTYIAIQRTVTREKLISKFWPNQDKDKAKNQLRVSLSHIKKLIDTVIGNVDDYFIANRDIITLRADVKMDYKTLLARLQFIQNVEQNPINMDEVIMFLQSLPETIFPSFSANNLHELRTEVIDTIIATCDILLHENITEQQQIHLLKIILKYQPYDRFYGEQLLTLQKDSSHLNRVEEFQQEEEYKSTVF